MDIFEHAQPIIQLVTTGGFGALVWYLIVKHLPYEREQFTIALNEQQVRHDDAIEKLQVRFDAQLQNQQQFFRDMIAQMTADFTASLNNAVANASDTK